MIGKVRIFSYSRVLTNRSCIQSSIAGIAKMSKEHHHSPSEHHSHHAAKPGIHRDWRLWAVVLMMLAAMAIYIASVDEAVAPGVKPGPEVPAAAQ